MKKTKLLISIFIITLMIIFPIITKASNYQINTNDYKSGGPSESDVKEMYRVGGRVAGVLQVSGTIVSFGSLIIIGIRYVIASVEEKAE